MTEHKFYDFKKISLKSAHQNISMVLGIFGEKKGKKEVCAFPTLIKTLQRALCRALSNPLIMFNSYNSKQ